MAVLALAPEELRELARELAPLIAAAMPEGRGVAAWIDAKTAAEYAGCSIHALHKAMAAREVEFRQDSKGGKAWFKVEWIDAWRGL